MWSEEEERVDDNSEDEQSNTRPSFSPSSYGSSNNNLDNSTHSSNKSSHQNVDTVGYHYEQLGAPTILFRPPLPSIDKDVTTTYPPHWGTGVTPSNKKRKCNPKEKKKVTHEIEQDLHDFLIQTDRVRIRRYLRHCLRYQMDTFASWENIIRTAIDKQDKQQNEQIQKQHVTQDDNTTVSIIQKKKTNERNIPSYYSLSKYNNEVMEEEETHVYQGTEGLIMSFPDSRTIPTTDQRNKESTITIKRCIKSVPEEEDVDDISTNSYHDPDPNEYEPFLLARNSMNHSVENNIYYRINPSLRDNTEHKAIDINYLAVDTEEPKKHSLLYDSSLYLDYNSLKDDQMSEEDESIMSATRPLKVASDCRRDRMHASPLEGYSTPFSVDTLQYGVSLKGKNKDKNDGVPSKRGKRPWYKICQPRRVEENPIYYGNCLSIIPCFCEYCKRINNNVHGTGTSSELPTSVSARLDHSSRNDSADSDKDDQILDAILEPEVKLENHPTAIDKKDNPDSSEQFVSDISTPMVNIVPRWFLIHSISNSVLISGVKFPYGNYQCDDHLRENTNSPYNTGCHQKEEIGKSIDVGGKVMQIANCFDLLSSKNDHTMGYSNKFHFVCRTPQTCSLISCTPGSKGTCHSTEWMKKKTPDDDDMNLCSGVYNIEEVARIDLTKKKNRSYIPVDVAASVGSNSWCLDHQPSFTILSRSNHQAPFQRGRTNTLHHVRMLNTSDPMIDTHQIPNIDLSLIEYMGKHPMLLWGAGRSTAQPKLYKGTQPMDAPMLGYGHSLYSIDLRCNKGSFMWSPSHAEFMHDGIQSICGILANYDAPHTVHVSSFSAGGKVWQLDSRMPGQVVCSWSLSGSCENYSSAMSATGVYGCGTLMTTPVNVQSRESVNENVNSRVGLPVLTASKYDCFGINLYQQPLSRPRFQTKNLEKPIHGIHTWDKDSSSSTAISTIFKSAGTFKDNFICGLTAFYTPATSILQNPHLLGYKSTPSDILCIISATSRGQLYSHTALKCKGDERIQSRACEGLPVGCCAIPVPDIELDQNTPSLASSDSNISSDLPWTLDNNYPTILDHLYSGSTASKVFPFESESVPLSQIPRYQHSSSSSSSSTSSERKDSEGHDNGFGFTYLPSGAFFPQEHSSHK